MPRLIHWDADKLAEMRIGQRMSYQAIGAALACHHTTVMLRCWDFGIEPRPPRRKLKNQRVLGKAAPREIDPAIAEFDERDDSPDTDFPRETDEQAAMWRQLMNEARRA